MSRWTNGNFVTDGLVDADRNPRPGLLDFKKVIEPLRITVGDDWAGFSLRNRQDFADTSAFSFRYTAEADDGSLDGGTVTVAPLAAQAETHVRFRNGCPSSPADCPTTRCPHRQCCPRGGHRLGGRWP